MDKTQPLDISSYTFRAVRPRDMPMLARWLTEPDVAMWYDDPDYIDSLRAHLDDARIQSRLVFFDGEPFAYVQDYDIHAWPGHHLSYLPAGSRGVDTFIGRSEMLGQGHGSRFLLALSHLLFDADVPSLGIDPHPENLRAIRAYQKVGFVIDGEVESEWGPVVLLSYAPGME